MYFIIVNLKVAKKISAAKNVVLEVLGIGDIEVKVFVMMFGCPVPLKLFILYPMLEIIHYLFLD